MQEIKVKLDVFEGPLDLLLHLIQKLEIDIYDIPIAKVTAQYLGYLQTMKHLQMEVVGEYFVMAATLMAIKSKMLLPKQEMIQEEIVVEDAQDPREALVAQLLTYRKYKYAADFLKEKKDERSLYFTKEKMALDAYQEQELPLPRNQLQTIDLFLAFHTMLEKKKKRTRLETKVALEEVSVDEKIVFISQNMQQRATNEGVSFASFFQNESRQEIITTFMALLELMKKGFVRVEQAGNYADILLFNCLEQATEIDTMEETL